MVREVLALKVVMLGWGQSPWGWALSCEESHPPALFQESDGNQLLRVVCHLQDQLSASHSGFQSPGPGPSWVGLLRGPKLRLVQEMVDFQRLL